MRPAIVAHRGGSALAPENTLAAIRRAVGLGVEAVEVDVQRTRDGRLVVHHDDTLERMTDAEGPIRERRFAELCRIDAGYRFSPDGL